MPVLREWWAALHLHSVTRPESASSVRNHHTSAQRADDSVHQHVLLTSGVQVQGGHRVLAGLWEGRAQIQLPSCQ